MTNDKQREWVLAQAKVLKANGKDLFSGTFTNSTGNPLLDFTKLPEGSIRACFAFNNTMTYYTFTEKEFSDEQLKPLTGKPGKM